jgi:hypothetical protein
MTTTFESASEQTEQSTQELPIVPTVEEMETWDEEKVLRWIQQRKPNLLKEDDVNNLKKARIAGSAFLDFDVESFKSCGLPVGIAVPLSRRVDEVK